MGVELNANVCKLSKLRILPFLVIISVYLNSKYTISIELNTFDVHKET